MADVISACAVKEKTDQPENAVMIGELIFKSAELLFGEIKQSEPEEQDALFKCRMMGHLGKFNVKAVSKMIR